MAPHHKYVSYEIFTFKSFKSHYTRRMKAKDDYKDNFTENNLLVRLSDCESCFEIHTLYQQRIIIKGKREFTLLKVPNDIMRFATNVYVMCLNGKSMPIQK